MNVGAHGPGAWQKLRRALLGSDLDSERLAQALHEAAARQAVPVIWLLGLTQSGKTSIVRALTGSSRAEIGNGFRPCTRTASAYDFPAEAPIVSFLDTRGPGEVDYAPDEDLALCEARAQDIDRKWDWVARPHAHRSLQGWRDVSG